MSAHRAAAGVGHKRHIGKLRRLVKALFVKVGQIAAYIKLIQLFYDPSAEMRKTLFAVHTAGYTVLAVPCKG